VTAAERAAFQAPADTSVSVDEVEMYLRTALTQIDLLRAEAPAAHARVAAARRARAAEGSPHPGTRRSPSPEAVWGDFVDETFVRAARKQGYNPAELWYVRDGISSVGGYLLASRMHASKDQAASLFRQQAEAMRGMPGVTPAQIETMLRAAEQAERQTEAPVPAHVTRNVATLRRARALTPATWGRIAGFAAGAGLSDLGALPEADAARRLDELEKLHRAALENREPASD
jgi:hypothetical protein